jgi:hypothetical protein
MDMFPIIKAGFMGFVLSVGVLVLVFYFIGGVLGLRQQRFVRVFLLAAIASFIVMDLYLYKKLTLPLDPKGTVMLAAHIGGWLSGIFSGLTHMKPLLLRCLGVR